MTNEEARMTTEEAMTNNEAWGEAFFGIAFSSFTRLSGFVIRRSPWHGAWGLGGCQLLMGLRKPRRDNQ
jgi:hypothetical protein